MRRITLKTTGFVQKNLVRRLATWRPLPVSLCVSAAVRPKNLSSMHVSFCRWTLLPPIKRVHVLLSLAKLSKSCAIPQDLFFCSVRTISLMSCLFYACFFSTRCFCFKSTRDQCNVVEWGYSYIETEAPQNVSTKQARW